MPIFSFERSLFSGYLLLSLHSVFSYLHLQYYFMCICDTLIVIHDVFWKQYRRFEAIFPLDHETTVRVK